MRKILSSPEKELRTRPRFPTLLPAPRLPLCVLLFLHFTAFLSDRRSSPCGEYSFLGFHFFFLFTFSSSPNTPRPPAPPPVTSLAQVDGIKNSWHFEGIKILVDLLDIGRRLCRPSAPHSACLARIARLYEINELNRNGWMMWDEGRRGAGKGRCERGARESESVKEDKKKR